MLVGQDDCPLMLHALFSLPRCHAGSVALGEFCEGDGECGTYVDHDNCDYQPFPLYLEVYQRIDCASQSPPPLPAACECSNSCYYNEVRRSHEDFS